MINVLVSDMPLTGERPGPGPRRSPCGPGEVNVLVAVHAPQVREALSAIVATLDGFCVVAEVSTAEEAVAAAAEFRPHLALVDQDLPNCGGEWAMQRLRAQGAVEGIVAISLRADQPTRQRAYAAGAHACVQTGASATEVLQAVHLALGTPMVSGNGAVRPSVGARQFA